jgi:hypothetical protein
MFSAAFNFKDMFMYSIGQLIGTLTLTYVVTRLFYFFHSKFFKEIKKLNIIIFIYGFFLLFGTIVGGYGFAQSGDGGPVFEQAFFTYLPATLIFLIFDLYKLKSHTEVGDEIPLATAEFKNPSGSKTSEKNFCSKCGEKLHESSRFCSSCGDPA